MTKRNYSVADHDTEISPEIQREYIKFHDQAKLPDDGIQWLLNRCHHRLRFLSPRSFEIDVPQEEWGVLYTELKKILQGLSQAGETTKKS